MLGNGVEISLIFRRILGPLNFRWARNHLVLGAQLSPGEIRLVCIPVPGSKHYDPNSLILLEESDLVHIVSNIGYQVHKQIREQMAILINGGKRANTFFIILLSY